MSDHPYTEAQVVRLIAKVRRTRGCWYWTASRFPGGYGQIRVSQKTKSAHRMVYEVFVGAIPEGLEIDHTCQRGHLGCVRPDHLEAVTHAENLRRANGWGGKNSRKTQCDNGHAFTEANTLRLKNGGRKCRTCNRDNARRHYQEGRTARAQRHGRQVISESA